MDAGEKLVKPVVTCGVEMILGLSVGVLFCFWRQDLTVYPWLALAVYQLLFISGWPSTVRDSPTSAFWVLGLRACASMPGLCFQFSPFRVLFYFISGYIAFYCLLYPV